MSTLPGSTLTKNELLKINDPTLGGSLGETMLNPEADRFPEDDEQFIKFHGIYQGDDRDLRKTGKKYIFMVRARIPAGVVPARQYLVLDDLATRYANDTLRITSRQSLQWHHVVKKNLGNLVKSLNDALITTIAACGDVNRNVMAPPTPATSPLVEQVIADSFRVNQALLPQTRAYHEIWINGKPLELSAEQKQSFEDPLYGKQYLPRKFKVAFAIPPLNDTDVLTNCLGFTAIADPANPSKLLGYNLSVGGGQGMSHGNAETYPRVADVLGFITPDQLIPAAKAVLTAYRDSGDRTNRRHARLKYVLAERGAAWFRSEIERRAGFALQDAKPFRFERQGDLFGWHRQSDGRWFLGVYVESGRIRDNGSLRLKSALRRVAEQVGADYRLTPTQNLLVVNVTDAQKAQVSALFAEHGIDVVSQVAAVRRNSMACVALPTCGLALAESERALPSLLDKLEGLLAELRLSEEEIIFRVTGCPNGCARPYMAEIALVGRAPNKYNILLGGDKGSTRLNREYKASVKTEDLVNELRPALTRWRDERQNGESFGDFAHRALL
jgi:sulfite reductase (NADPH) hemoprotein beta-component